MTTPYRYRLAWTARILEQAHAWSWNDATLAEYIAVLDRIDDVLTTGDTDGMDGIYRALVTLDDRTRFGSRADHPAHADPAFPHERTNELVHRLRSVAGPRTEPPRPQPAGEPASCDPSGDRDRAS